MAAIPSLDVLSVLGPVIFGVNWFLHHLFAKNCQKYPLFTVASVNVLSKFNVYILNRSWKYPPHKRRQDCWTFICPYMLPHACVSLSYHTIIWINKNSFTSPRVCVYFVFIIDHICRVSQFGILGWQELLNMWKEVVSGCKQNEVNSPSPGQKGCHFTNSIFKLIFLYEKFQVLI